MIRFDLIQRGEFRKQGTTLTGRTGVVDLDYMGSSEFEYGAIPRSFRRILYNYDKSDYFNTKIYTPEKDELILFCNKDISDQTIEALHFFINDPYPLLEYTELEKIPTTRKNERKYRKKRFTDFWWCIDLNQDWMAFLESNKELFAQGINHDYYEWWMQKPEEERENEIKLSLRK